MAVSDPCLEEKSNRSTKAKQLLHKIRSSMVRTLKNRIRSLTQQMKKRSEKPNKICF